MENLKNIYTFACIKANYCLKFVNNATAVGKAVSGGQVVGDVVWGGRGEVAWPVPLPTSHLAFLSPLPHSTPASALFPTALGMLCPFLLSSSPPLPHAYPCSGSVRWQPHSSLGHRTRACSGSCSGLAWPRPVAAVVVAAVAPTPGPSQSCWCICHQAGLSLNLF